MTEKNIPVYEISKKTTTKNINKYKDITPPPQNTTTPSQNTNTPNITQLPLPASTSPPVQEEENTSIFDTIADIFT